MGLFGTFANALPLNLKSYPRRAVLPLVAVGAILPQSRALAQEVSVSAANAGDEVPQSMGALGDSISAGMLANFSRASANRPWVETWFLLRTLIAGSLFKMKGLEKKPYSWSAGYTTEGYVLSHAHRVAALDVGRQLRVFNAASSGDTVVDVYQNQLPRLSNWAQNKLQQKYPDYVTILIGANDLCADKVTEMTPLNTFYDRYEKVVSELVEKSPRTKVLISTLPNIENLRSVALGQRLWGWGPLKRCENAWNALKLCRTLTLESDPANRATVARFVKDYNDAMHDVAAKVNQRYGDRVRVSDQVYDVKFNADMLSMDCFHPNPEGQRTLSRESWKATWWANDFGPQDDAALVNRLRMNARCGAEKAKERAYVPMGRGQGTPYRMTSTCSQWLRQPASARATGSIRFEK